MRRKTCIILTIIITIIISTAIAATADVYRMREQANSEFRIAEKAYRKAIKDYGESLEGMHAKEKASACKKIGSALYDNKWQANNEDVFAKPQYTKQVTKLEDYAKALGCSK
ncbi:hypothetical protein OAN24_00780 [Pseudodesulfovibrio sp.]|nr:hypothetical protein [Pseudodesulfovibrio sp.]